MSFWSSGFWADGFWSDEFWGADAPEQPAEVDGSGLVVTRKRRRAEPVRAKKRTPDDIRREQLEDERYLASLEKQKAQPVPEQARTSEYAEGATMPAAQPILADVAARAALAVQAKLEEAQQAAASARIADDKRRRTLALLLALD